MIFVWAALLCSVQLTVKASGWQAEDDIVKLVPGVTPPTLLRKVEPQYSDDARNARVQGTILFQIVIDELGFPTDIVVLSPLGFGLDEKALEAVSQWRFEPASRNGKPVKCFAQVEVNFHLGDQSFDVKAEEQRTRYNAIITRLSQQKDGTPSDADIKAMQKLANQKMPAAEFALGRWELDGKFLPKNLEAGLASIQKAADKKYGPALYFVGDCYRQGNLLPKDPAKGLSLIQNAARLGSNKAQFALGEMYQKGSDGEASDLDRARKYFRLCAASGTPQCQFRLGSLLLSQPQHKEQDWLQAVAWLQLAESHDLPEAQPLADSETAKLTPEQMQSVARLRRDLERNRAQ